MNKQQLTAANHLDLQQDETELAEVTGYWLRLSPTSRIAAVTNPARKAQTMGNEYVCIA